MNARPTPRPFASSLLIFLQAFLGVQGLYGGIAFLLAPDGSLLGMPFSYLKSSPFTSFLLPGLLLFLFLGIYPIAVAYSLWARPDWPWPDALNPFKTMHWSWAASLAAGVIAMIWIIVQIQWIPPGFLHGFIFGWGVLILVVTLLPVVRRYYARA